MLKEGYRYGTTSKPIFSYSKDVQQTQLDRYHQQIAVGMRWEAVTQEVESIAATLYGTVAHNPVGGLFWDP